MEIAKRIRKLRMERSLPSSSLAQEAGVEPEFLVLLEDGQKVPTWETIENLAAALDIPVRQLFFDEHRRPVTPWLTPRLTLEELEEQEKLWLETPSKHNYSLE
jgi:DNA-binding XRE family transcriptional regulator